MDFHVRPSTDFESAGVTPGTISELQPEGLAGTSLGNRYTEMISRFIHEVIARGVSRSAIVRAIILVLMVGVVFGVLLLTRAQAPNVFSNISGSPGQ